MRARRHFIAASSRSASAHCHKVVTNSKGTLDSGGPEPGMRSSRVPAIAPAVGKAREANVFCRHMPTELSPAMRRSDPLIVLRYLDVVIVVLAAPFVLLTGLPALGYAVGAAAWIVQRIAGVWIEDRMRRERDIRAVVGLGLGASLGRAWFVGLSIL